MKTSQNPHILQSTKNYLTEVMYFLTFLYIILGTYIKSW